MYLLRVVLSFGLLLMVTGCKPATVEGKKPNKKIVKIIFYPGGDQLDDLIIIKGKNYFGKAEYYEQEPLGNIIFKLNNNKEVKAECTRAGRNVAGKSVCKKYKIYESNFKLVPEGTVFTPPSDY